MNLLICFGFFIKVSKHVKITINVTKINSKKKTDIFIIEN